MAVTREISSRARYALVLGERISDSQRCVVEDRSMDDRL